MDRGPRRRLLHRLMWEAFGRIRRYGEAPESELAAALADLPGVLRELAGQFEAPDASIVPHAELPGLDGYSVWAATYDHEPDNPVVAGEEEVIWQVLGSARGLRVLDAGCGTGRHAIPLAQQGADVVGIEPTLEMLEHARAKARARGLALDLRAGRLEDIGPALGEFDLVLCCLVLSHVEDLAGSVARLAARLRPGGRLVVSDFHPFNLLLGARTSCRSGDAKYVVPNYLHLPSDYFQAMRAAGLAVTQLHEVGELERFPGLPMALVLEGRGG